MLQGSVFATLVYLVFPQSWKNRNLFLFIPTHLWDFVLFSITEHTTCRAFKDFYFLIVLCFSRGKKKKKIEQEFPFHKNLGTWNYFCILIFLWEYFKFQSPFYVRELRPLHMWTEVICCHSIDQVFLGLTDKALYGETSD